MNKKLATAALTAAMTIAGAMTAFAGEWKQDQVGWWYQNDDGGYTTNNWQWIDGKCYYFNNVGYMLADTVTPDGYTVSADGAWDGQAAKAANSSASTGISLSNEEYMTQKRAELTKYWGERKYWFKPLIDDGNFLRYDYGQAGWVDCRGYESIGTWTNTISPTGKKAIVFLWHQPGWSNFPDFVTDIVVSDEDKEKYALADNLLYDDLCIMIGKIETNKIFPEINDESLKDGHLRLPRDFRGVTESGHEYFYGKVRQPDGQPVLGAGGYTLVIYEK